MPVVNRIVSAWNAFRSHEITVQEGDYDIGPATYSGYRPDRTRFRFMNERSIVTSIYTRIAIDIAAIDLRHIQLDEQDRYKEDVDSGLNWCLTHEANIDQAPRHFIQDIVATLFDKGCAAIVPVDTSRDPNDTLNYEIYTLRVGSVVGWYPKHVRVDLYNEAKGIHEEILLEKRFVAIVENPLYSVMNEPNSTLQRLLRKLSLLDNVDETSAGKLDLIIQLPYVVKNETRRAQAQARKEEIEFQLKGSDYGIAYTDGTEKITQLNRGVENGLLPQVEYLTKMLYGQLGITEDVMNGTATEEAMINYFNRTVEPILGSITQAMDRTFLGRVKINLGQRIRHYRDPFKFVPVSVLAEIVDKFTRNEVTTGNEIRAFLGMKPSSDPKADQLINSNNIQYGPQGALPPAPEDDGAVQSAFDDIDKALDDVFKDLDIAGEPVS